MEIAFYFNISLTHSFFNQKLELRQLKTNIPSTWQQNFMFSIANPGSDIFLFIKHT